MKHDNPLSIILADDHKILRSGIRKMLENEAGYTVVAEAENGRDTVKYVQEFHPDLVIMDVTMPDMNGIEATRQIMALDVGTRIIALSMHSGKPFVEGMLRAGAFGYLLKSCELEELIQAIESVMSGKIFLTPEITGIVVKDYVKNVPSASSDTCAELSPRENEVLQLIAEGKTTKEIAHVLCVSTKTIDNHRQRIMGKLNMRSIAELTKYAIRIGLTSTEI